MTDAPVPEGNEADILEQATPVDERPAIDTSKLEDLPVEANEADVFEQSQAVPADPDEGT